MEGRNRVSIALHFGLGREKVKQYINKQIVHKVKVMSQETIDAIVTFFGRDDISRVTGCVRESTKKYGPRRYMNFSFSMAYRIFKAENPTMKVSFSKFHFLKPFNIRLLSKTPLVSSLCVYCQNVKLKLLKLNIPNLTSEYELFCKFTCKRKEGETFSDAKCISKACPKCKNWETALRQQISNVNDMNKAVVWQSWVSRDFKTRDGKPSIRRVLESKCGTVETCTNELIKDDLKHPLKRCSFFEHFNTQMYQQKMYKICRSLCEEGMFIMVQDFSRNRDIFYQFEIKSSYWTRNKSQCIQQ